MFLLVVPEISPASRLAKTLFRGPKVESNPLKGIVEPIPHAVIWGMLSAEAVVVVRQTDAASASFVVVILVPFRERRLSLTSGAGLPVLSTKIAIGRPSPAWVPMIATHYVTFQP